MTVVTCFRLLLITSLLPIVALSDAHAAPYRYRLDIHRCGKPSDALMQSLDKEWLPWQPFVEICPVPGATGTVRLSVLTIRLDLWEKISHRPLSDERWPAARIIDTDGRTVGHLAQFPIDPPAKIGFTFTDFRDDWPWKIELFDEPYPRYRGFSSSHGPMDPMVWREATNDFCWKAKFATKQTSPDICDHE